MALLGASQDEDDLQWSEIQRLSAKLREADEKRDRRDVMPATRRGATVAGSFESTGEPHPPAPFLQINNGTAYLISALIVPFLPRHRWRRHES